MKKLLSRTLWIALPFIVGTATAATAAGPEATVLSAEEVRAAYPQLFAPKRVPAPPGGEWAYRGIVVEVSPELDPGHPLQPLLQQNLHLIRFLLTQSGVAGDELRAAAESPDYPRSYFQRLEEAPAFDSLFMEIAQRYLRQQGGDLTGHSPMAVDRRSMDQVLNTAVRFVYPDGRDEEGHYRTHFCTLFNALDGLPDRSLAVEAMAYSAIIGELYRESSAFMDDFDSTIRLAEVMHLAEDDETAVQRAQGLVWGFLMTSESFRTVLQAELERIGDLLPVEISE